MQLCSSFRILWHCLSLGLEWKLTFSSPVATAEFSKFAGILSAALSQHHLLAFEIAQLEFHPLALVMLPKAHLGIPCMTNLHSILKSRDIILLTKFCIVKFMVFPVVIYRCKSCTINKFECQRIYAFELWCWRRLKNPLDHKEIKSFNPKGNQPWIFIGKTEAEFEAPILWPPDVQKWLIGEVPDAGKDWKQEDKGTIEDELVGWHQQLSGHEFEQVLADGEGQGSLACCSPWCCKESDTTEWLNYNNNISCRCTAYCFTIFNGYFSFGTIKYWLLSVLYYTSLYLTYFILSDLSLLISCPYIASLLSNLYLCRHILPYMEGVFMGFTGCIILHWVNAH